MVKILGEVEFIRMKKNIRSDEITKIQISVEKGESRLRLKPDRFWYLVHPPQKGWRVISLKNGESSNLYHELDEAKAMLLLETALQIKPGVKPEKISTKIRRVIDKFEEKLEKVPREFTPLINFRPYKPIRDPFVPLWDKKPQVEKVLNLNRTAFFFVKDDAVYKHIFHDGYQGEHFTELFTAEKFFNFFDRLDSSDWGTNQGLMTHSNLNDIPDAVSAIPDFAKLSIAEKENLSKFSGWLR